MSAPLARQVGPKQLMCAGSNASNDPLAQVRRRQDMPVEKVFAVRKYFSIVVLLLLALSAPSQGAEPANALLQRAREAAGGKVWDKVERLTYEGAESSSGMPGTAVYLDDVKTGRMRHSSDLQIFQTVEIWNGVWHWRQDFSGGVHALDAEFALRCTATDEWLARRAYLKPRAEKAKLGAVEHRTDAGKDYEVVTITPRHGQPAELWFGSTDSLLARAVRLMSANVVTVTYADYRSLKGMRLPFKITQDDGLGNIDVIDVSEYRVNQAIKNDAFLEPHIPNDTTVEGGKATVPMEFDGHIVFEARLNGKGPFAFILDTGGRSILTQETAAALGLQSSGNASVGGAGSGLLTYKFAKVEHVEIGGVTIQNQPFMVVPLPYTFVGRGKSAAIAGIVGLEFLERLAVRVDYRNRTLTFWPSDSYRHAGPGQVEPITFIEDVPRVHARVNGAVGEFMLDTGSFYSVFIFRQWAERHGLAEELKRGIQTVTFGAGGESQSWASRVPQFAIGGRSFPRTIAVYVEDKQGAFSSSTEAGNIGSQVLTNFALEIDYARGRTWFEFVPGFDPFPFSRTGLSFYRDDPKSLMLSDVMANSPAAEAGLRKGDRVVAMADEAVADISSPELIRLLNQPPGAKLPMTYTRDGQESKAVLVLREMLP